MAFDFTKTSAYVRDTFVPFTDASLSIASSPILYGLSIYTVFAFNWNPDTRSGVIFRLREHYDRLVNSARIMDFHTFANEWSFERFQEMALELIRRNNIQEDALVRVTVFIDELIAGTKIHGLKNSLSAYVYPMGELLALDGIHACISSWVRNADNSIPAKAKVNGSYVNASLMKNEALLNGYDEAIALDHNGHVAEATVANIFVVRNGVLATPDTSTDILEGITRDSILKLAPSLNIPVEERSIDRTELYKTDEIFLCGSSARITPVLSIDKRPIGDGTPGPVTTKLQAAYHAASYGQNPDFASWCTTVL
ncbi:MAG TPA: branched-chain amino acid transaminase [Candidatus Saccharimonadales bacterium]|nr:branched-chain amino acid transaminase [Candidatus Saccharimonadales bacterium]